MMTPEQIAYYDKLEGRFLRLLELMQPIFPSEKLAQFKEYIDVGEYGLALDGAQWIFTTENQKASPAILQMMKELAETMEHPLLEPFASMKL